MAYPLPPVLASSNAMGKSDNIQQIQAECSQMMSMLKDLEKEEHQLDCQLEILAREAMLCGFQPEKVEKVLLRKPPVKKRRPMATVGLAHLAPKVVKTEDAVSENKS